MKVLKLGFLLLILSITSNAQLDTKLIASKYGNSIVKIILMDPVLEKEKPGSGYLTRGSGFFVTKDGYIFTNRHVVEWCVTGFINYDYKDSYGKTQPALEAYSEDIINKSNFIKAYITGYTDPIIQVFHGKNENDFKLYVAKVVAIGMGAFDGAILKVISDEEGKTDGFNFNPVPLGNSDLVQQGENLCVFGFPAQYSAGLEAMIKDMSTLSTGIMSGFDYVINSDYGYIKTDAEIHPGNSGGPVFNEANKVIGIATARGIKTGIGLVGGVNGMYFVSATDSKGHKELVSRGLIPPERSFSINTITGTRLPIRTPSQINGTSSSSSTSNTSSATGAYYSNAKVYFSNISVKDNNNKLPSSAQQYTRFTVDKKAGGKLWVYLDNYPSPLKTSGIIVLVDKKNKKGDFEKYLDKVYDIESTLDYTYFSYPIEDKGIFRFSIYSKDKLFIKSGIVEVNYK